MSYIINNSDAFVNVKLTEKGREQLAQGTLNFSFWAIGDSEINYDREAVVADNPNDVTLSAMTKILRPKDQQPNLKSWIYSDLTATTINPLNNITDANIKTLKVVVNNEAEERGFFSGDSIYGWTTLTGSPYTVSTGIIYDDALTGGTKLDIGSIERSEGDLILLKLANSTLGGIAPNSNTEAIPHLWYKIQEGATGNTITVDRNLPELNGAGSTPIQFIIYKGGEVYNSFGNEESTSYWDSGTLSFDSSCHVTCGDVPIWNMNNVWCESIAGTTGNTHETYEYYGSYPYLGQKNPYFEYKCTSDDANEELKCDGFSEIDSVKKSISIIHYTNNVISNLYGEFLYVDTDNDKTVKLHLPDLMYHRRNFDTISATTMGMSFLASGDTENIGTSDIEYIPLIEDPEFLMSGDTPQIVGKVFPQLKMVIIDDEEIVASMSYKSNRNWTLPRLEANLSNPTGTTGGILTQNNTMYLTYVLETSGLTNSLGCQYYTKITNQTSLAKDVQFNIDGTGLLKYMRKIELPDYDGRGFYAYKFKVLYQIVEDADDRPDPSNWKVYDFTSTNITGNIGETIDPTLLENQIPVSNGFILDDYVGSASTIYSAIDTLSLPPIMEPELLQFGDGKFFYGNLETYIGATIYKTIFDIRVNSGQFIATTNPTRSTDPSTNPPNIRVSEVGIYDSDNNLVVIGKLSKPIELVGGNTIMIEMAMDF